jgi:uncharacterized protein involved in exopolysaccharide biosynthesis
MAMNDPATRVDGVPPPRRVADDQEITLSDLLLVLWRYRLVLGACIVIAGSLALLISWNRTPVYQASSRLLVTPPKIADPGAQPVSLATYQALISNQRVILEVIKSLGLTEPPYGLTAQEALQRNISVQPVPDTNILLITARLGNPALAADLANRLAERSVRLAQEVTQDDVVATRDAIKRQLDESRSRLVEAERQLIDYRKQTQVEALTAEVDVLLRERAKAMPLLVAIEAERARIRQTTEELAAQQPVRQAQRAVTPRLVARVPPEPQAAAVKGANAPRESSDNLSGDPAAMPSDSQLRIRDDVLDPYVNPVYEVLSEQLAASRTKLSELETQRVEILRATDLSKAGGKKLNDLYTSQAQLERLKEEADLARKMYLDVSTRYQQALLQVTGRSPQIQVIDVAVAPQNPVAPRILRDTALAGLATFVLASAALLLYAAVTGRTSVSAAR